MSTDRAFAGRRPAIDPAKRLVWLLGISVLGWAPGLAAQTGSDPAAILDPADVFGLEWASDPRVNPDGSQVVYQRNFFDVMTDRARSNLWIASTDGNSHRPLTTGNENDGSPRWSPDGGRLLYASGRGDGPTQLWVRWMDGSRQEARVTNLTESPSGLAWSPDGRWIAFTMFVGEAGSTFAQMPPRPEGAEWAPPAVVIDDVQYRADGVGYLEAGNQHVFVVPSDGGTPRQLTQGPYDHASPAWTPDGGSILVSANRRDDADLEAPNDTEIWEVSVADGSMRVLTDRFGPDATPAVSPDGRLVAYTGFDDAFQGYEVTRLYVMGRDGSGRRTLATELDRDVSGVVWGDDSRGVYVQYDDGGDTKVAFVGLDGEVTEVVDRVGGTSLGRPYSGGSFSQAGGTVAYTLVGNDHPSDVAVVPAGGGEPRRLTSLNEDLLDHLELGAVEELWWESSHDGRSVQGWIVTPPGFDPTRRYPLLLEIHGGPFANYGSRFSTEVQLYAAAGYVVLYANPRGSTGYGKEFGNLIHHAYPGFDYDDLMSGVDAVIERGYVDEDRLFVTGGSGGGVLSAWIVGKTDRFRAAVVQKPVIHWTSFVLHADAIPFFYKYWFPDYPWEDPEHYWARSPLSLVGNVTTPTMLLTGELDYRTPISESEQFYAALKLQGVESMLVRIPEASHGIANRPSNLIAKVVHVLKWFETHQPSDRPVS